MTCHNVYSRDLIFVAAKRKGVPFTVYLTDEQFARLEQLSSSRLVSKSDLIRVALDEFLAHERRRPSGVGVNPRRGRIRR
jgi:hypothetical protein